MEYTLPETNKAFMTELEVHKQKLIQTSQKN